MVQFRKSHPARRRRIKRDRVGVERKGVAGLKLKAKTVEEVEDSKNKKDTVGDSDNSLLTKSSELENKSSHMSLNERKTCDREPESDINFQFSERKGESSHDLTQQSSSRELSQGITRDLNREITGESSIEAAITSQSIGDNLSELLNRTL